MADLSDKGSECEDMSNGKNSPDRCGSSSSSSDGGSHFTKTCANCGTTKTPLWRGGPAGPKSLCNACGIRSRKKRRALVGLKKDENDFCLKRKLMALGTEVVLQRPTSTLSNQKRKLGEVEQAALLLMAISYGSIYYA